ncbi:hypothetical protein QYF36_010964 [Acer negundo]|nr:hypothetical protein QYF36_010964 [Acer negundo]
MWASIVYILSYLAMSVLIIADATFKFKIDRSVFLMILCIDFYLCYLVYKKRYGNLHDIDAPGGAYSPRQSLRWGHGVISLVLHADAAAISRRRFLKRESTESILELEKKYTTYVVYGVMGRGELPLKEKLLLALALALVLALVTLVPIRVVLAMYILILYYLICRICTLFSAPNQDDKQEDYTHLGCWRRTVIVQSGRFLSRSTLFVFGMKRLILKT